MSDFKVFKAAVQEQWEKLQQYPLARTQVSKELLWDTYIESFPEGTNKMFRERREYDCNCCKSFIRAIGNVVALTDDGIISLWDCALPAPYDTVAKAMSTLVHRMPINNVFSHEEKVAGVDRSLVAVGETWEHFFVRIPKKYQLSATKLSEMRGTYDVFKRGLQEITQDSLETVIELVEQGSLYRGDENVAAVRAFLKCKLTCGSLGLDPCSEWLTSLTIPPGVARIRNTAIGTLLQDLSGGMPLDDAVRRYENVVAPANYKRPTAIVTKGMIKKAEQAVADLGFMEALARRYAVPEDVTVNNVLFADRTTKPLMKNAFEEMADAVPETVTAKSLERIEEIPLDKFLADVLPKADSIDLLIENRHEANMVTLLAPVDSEAKCMLKWPNNFSWSYNGDVTDSIKQKVKAAGGDVTGDFRASLAWWNSDDLDLHLYAPNFHIGFDSKLDRATGGFLDIDMNASQSGRGYDPNTPVENITYPQRSKMKEGIYKLKVHQYSLRKRENVGFTVEVEFGGVLRTFHYPKVVKNREFVVVAKFSYTHKDGIKILESLEEANASKEVWGIGTHNYHKVRMVMNSPNHWNGGAVGNRHVFFVLEDCHKEGTARGFYNEFLTDDLRDHRKVFEVLGSRMKATDSEDQLSGVGFSTTLRNNVLCRVQGSFNRTVKVMI